MFTLEKNLLKEGSFWLNWEVTLKIYTDNGKMNLFNASACSHAMLFYLPKHTSKHHKAIIFVNKKYWFSIKKTNYERMSRKCGFRGMFKNLAGTKVVYCVFLLIMYD